MARIDPLAPAEWPDEMREALAPLRPTGTRHPPPKREGRPKGLNVLGVLARHPSLARAFNVFNSHVLFDTTLTERQRELLVLRVAALRNCEYEWRQHAVMAGDVGLDPNEVKDTVVGPSAPRWEDADRALLRAVDELVSDATISTETWSALSTALSSEQVMDLVFTVGCYDLLAMAFNGFGLELDEDLVALMPTSPLSGSPAQGTTAGADENGAEKRGGAGEDGAGAGATAPG
jgi:alkylhydroperoxidase family enzyme